MSEMKSPGWYYNDGLDSAGQESSALEDTAIQTTHGSRQRGKSIFKTKRSIAERRGNFTKVNLRVTRVPAVAAAVVVVGMGQKNTARRFQMWRNYKDTDPRSCTNPGTRNMKKTAPVHKRSGCSKPVIKKSHRQPQNGSATHRGAEQLPQQRHCKRERREVLKIPEEMKKCQARILFPLKIAFRKQKRNQDVLRHTKPKDLSPAGLLYRKRQGKSSGRREGEAAQRREEQRKS